MGCFNLHFLLTAAAEHPVLVVFLGISFCDLLIASTAHFSFGVHVFCKIINVELHIFQLQIPC